MFVARILNSQYVVFVQRCWSCCPYDLACVRCWSQTRLENAWVVTSTIGLTQTERQVVTRLENAWVVTSTIGLTQTERQVVLSTNST